MWELVKRSLQRERTKAGAQLGRPRRASVQRMHNEIVETFLKAGRQAKRSGVARLSSMDEIGAEGRRGMRGGGLWRAVSNLGFAIAMAIRLLNPYVLISVAFGQHRSLLSHLSARVDSMRAVLSSRTGRRRRLTAWIQDTLPQRHVPEAATAVWQDGSLLCGIVETAVPGSCPGYDALSHPNTDRSATLWLGQKLAARYLGVPPAFTDEDLAHPFLSVTMERRLLRYLSSVRVAAARVEAERQKRLRAIEGTYPSSYADDAYSSDCIVQSALGPGESMLECVARGMGLILGVKDRRSTFYLYLNPNHPHRHVHRLMQSCSRDPNLEEEAGAILMQIRGPDGEFGATLISTAPGSNSTSGSPSLAVLNQQWCGRIPISYETSEESVMVSYVPRSSGAHELSLLLRGGSHVPGSPFSVSVENSVDVPDDGGKRKRFGIEKIEIQKASSYESGLDRMHHHTRSSDSDPGVQGNEYQTFRKMRVVSRVVDFVTEKMLLTEEGKLERVPKQQRGSSRATEEDDSGTTEGENPLQSRRRYFSTLSPTRSRIRRNVLGEGTHGTYPGRKPPGDSDGTASERESSRSDRETPDEEGEKGKNGERIVRVADVAEHQKSPNPSSTDFRDHCRRILWLCDILMEHRPHQESLEILNTAGNILDGKRVHPTIMEESEPEESSAAPSSTVVNTATIVQRLQRPRSEAGGLNEVSGWKEGRRHLHTWARPDRGGSVAGGRLLHKGGSYRGIVVRDLTAEAITGAYAGGDDGKEEEEEAKEEEQTKDLFLEGRAAPKTPYHSLPKRKAVNLMKLSENRGLSVERLEPIASSDPDTDSGRTAIFGKTPKQNKPPPSAASSPDSESDVMETPRGFLSTPITAIRRHSTDVSGLQASIQQYNQGRALLGRRRGSGDLGSPVKVVESKKRFSRARQFFETLEKGKDSPPAESQSGAEDAESSQKESIKKKKGRGTTTDDETGRGSTRKSGTKHRPSLQGVRDSSESTPDSEQQEVERRQRRKARRTSPDKTHSAPGSDVDSNEGTPQRHPHRRKRATEFALRSHQFGGSERQPRVSERFNVMDLFKDVAGGELSGRATPLGIPHQAAVLAALRSVEEVLSAEAASPYDLYKPMEAVNDCEPSEVTQDENANLEATEEEEGNVTFDSQMTLSATHEYQAEYPHLPMTSPRQSRRRSTHADLIPRKVLLNMDNNQTASISSPRRSKAELF